MEKKRRNILGVLVIAVAALLVFYVVWSMFIRDPNAKEEEAVESTWEDESWDYSLDFEETDESVSVYEYDESQTYELEDFVDEDSLETWVYRADDVINEDFELIGLDSDTEELIDVDSLKNAIQTQLWRDGFNDFQSATVSDVERTDNSIVISMMVTCDKLVDIDMTTYFDGNWYLKVWSSTDPESE